MDPDDSTLDVLIAYLRAELAWYQRRIEVANTQAAGTITVAIAFAAVAATALAAVHRQLHWLSIVMLAVGTAAILAGAIRAFSAMDTSQATADWYTFIFDRWFLRKLVYVRVQRLLADRRGIEAGTAIELSDDVRVIVAHSLKLRLNAAQRVVAFHEKDVRIAGIFTVLGIGLVIAGAAVVLA